MRNPQLAQKFARTFWTASLARFGTASVENKTPQYSSIMMLSSPTVVSYLGSLQRQFPAFPFDVGGAVFSVLVPVFVAA
jgi:hypothetical protein